MQANFEKQYFRTQIAAKIRYKTCLVQTHAVTALEFCKISYKNVSLHAIAKQLTAAFQYTWFTVLFCRKSEYVHGLLVNYIVLFSRKCKIMRRFAVLLRNFVTK